MDRRQEGVALDVGGVFAVTGAGSDQFDDSALDEEFGLFRVFQLFADSHPLSRPYQFGQIGVYGVERKACQFDRSRRARRAFGERDAQNPGGRDGVFAECLVEISHPVEQDGIRIFRFGGVILLHQRRLSAFFLCHEN